MRASEEGFKSERGAYEVVDGIVSDPKSKLSGAQKVSGETSLNKASKQTKSKGSHARTLGPSRQYSAGSSSLASRTWPTSTSPSLASGPPLVPLCAICICVRLALTSAGST